MSKPQFPKTVKVGHTVVKIYHSLSRGCDSYTVVHYLGNKRIRQNFADLGLATTAAQTIAISAGELISSKDSQYTFDIFLDWPGGDVWELGNGNAFCFRRVTKS